MKRTSAMLFTSMFLVHTALAQTPAPPPTTVDASRGGVTVSSGPNSLTVGARLQLRWIVDDRESFDADLVGEGVGVDDPFRSQFDVARLRLMLSGGAFKPWLRYGIELELNRTSGEGGSRIKDAFLEFRPTDRPYRLRAGQFKVPFGLQQLTSSGRQEFVDRAITDPKFDPARDMGVMFAGAAASNKFGYAIGVFNGSGESIRQANRTHIWAGRIFFDPLGEYVLSEGSSDALDSPILHFGFGARGGEPVRGRGVVGVFEEADNENAYNLEFAFKSLRFYSTAEYFWMTNERQNPGMAPDIDSHGYHAQAGVMLIPARLETAVRYAAINPDSDVDDAGVQEIRGVVGYYWRSHNLKLQADIGQIRYDNNFAALPPLARAGLPPLGPRLVTGEDLADTELRVQLQLAF